MIEFQVFRFDYYSILRRFLDVEMFSYNLILFLLKLCTICPDELNCPAIKYIHATIHDNFFICTLQFLLQYSTMTDCLVNLGQKDSKVQTKIKYRRA